MVYLKDLDCTKIVQEEQLVVPWIRKRTDPYVLAKSAEIPLIPKCFPNALGQRNAQECASR